MGDGVHSHFTFLRNPFRIFGIFRLVLPAHFLYVPLFDNENGYYLMLVVPGIGIVIAATTGIATSTVGT